MASILSDVKVVSRQAGQAKCVMFKVAGEQYEVQMNGPYGEGKFLFRTSYLPDGNIEWTKVVAKGDVETEREMRRLLPLGDVNRVLGILYKK